MPDDGVNAGAVAGAVAGGIMLFGVRLTVDSMRKSVSLNDLSHYALPNEVAADVAGAAAGDGAGCYASADEAAAPSTPPRERKRGIPWTEEEHRLFLLGLHKVGKGDWRGISRNFVKTRTPTQVASHAQKYFIRRSNVSRRRRRSSLFDITTDALISSGNDKKPPPANDPVPPAMEIGDRYPTDENRPEKSPSNYRHPIEIYPEPSTLSLELSLALEEHRMVIRPPFPSFSGDSVISVG